MVRRCACNDFPHCDKTASGTPACKSFSLKNRGCAATASAMLLAAERFDAAHMMRCGFLAWSVPDEAVQTQADALLARMLALSPQAARLNKQVLRQELPAQAPTPVSAYAYADNKEHHEGVQAFLEKRRPDF